MSTVGGIAIPPVDHYIAGFQAGAKAADPGVKLLNGYSGDFVAQDKCQGLAQQQIAQGSDIIFQVAGQCGLGAINAARDKGYWGIGVDTDQSLQIGSKQLLVSAVKGVDVSVVDVVGQVVNHKFRGGKDLLLGVNEKGAGIQGINSAVPAVDQGQGQRAAREDEGRQGARSRPCRWSSRHGGGSALRLGFRGLERRSGARAPRDHEAIRHVHRQRRDRPRSARGRGARAAGRERSGQVDAHERPLRPLQAGRGGDLRARPARGDHELRRRDPPRHRHGAPALHADPGDDGRREHRARRRADRSTGSSTSTPRASACASSRRATAWPSSRTP